MDVSVLVPVLDEARHLPDATRRMLAQDFPGTAEFLFVDGGSTDGSREILADLARTDARVRVLDNPARRTPQALNLGLRAAAGEFIARMDAHTRYPPDYLRLGIERLRRGDDVLHVSGPALAAGHGGFSDVVAAALSTRLGVGGADFRRDASGEVEVDTGFAGLWRRAILLAAGGWDEGWPTDQDCELAFRLSAEGGRHVMLPAMAAEYLPRTTPQALWRQYRQFGRHKIKTFRRHPAAMRPSHLLPPLVVATGVSTVAAPVASVRWLARLGIGLYATTLVVSSVRSAHGARETVGLPLAWATMHVAYGVGLWEGVATHGVPTRAVAGALRRVADRS